MAKFFLVIALIAFGMLFNEHRILENIALMEAQGAKSLNNHVLTQNHATLKAGMAFSASGFILLIIIAVYKPWMKRRTVNAAA